MLSIFSSGSVDLKLIPYNEMYMFCFLFIGLSVVEGATVVAIYLPLEVEFLCLIFETVHL